MNDLNLNVRNKFDKAWRKYDAIANELWWDCHDLIANIKDDEELHDCTYDLDRLKSRFDKYLYLLDRVAVSIEDSREELKDVKFLETMATDMVANCEDCMKQYNKFLKELKS